MERLESKEKVTSTWHEGTVNNRGSPQAGSQERPLCEATAELRSQSWGRLGSVSQPGQDLSGRQREEHGHKGAGEPGLGKQ